jgi:two-component system alkaline phosphatase synthesis response regulator PhoP
VARERPTILVVDDEEPLLLLVTMTLQTEPYRVLVARDGEEALALARAERPDFVLLDVGLPKIDGLEVCRRLRADPTTRETTIVMLSARAAEEDRAAGLAAGADDYLTKPFRPREFVSYLAGRLPRPPPRP